VKLIKLFIVSLLLMAAASVNAVAPSNPGFEDLPDLDGWNVLDIGDYSGGGWVVRGEDATEGDAFGRLGLFEMYAFGEWAYGPAFQSPFFSAVDSEVLSVDWRVRSLGPCGSGGDPFTGDEGLGRGYLFDAGADPAVDLPAATFFDVGPICSPLPWDTSLVEVPYTGDFYLLLQVGSYDATGGGVIGAELDVDNIFSVNVPPDCSGAQASPSMLWPPNHKFHDIAITGVTDPDGDAFTLTVDAIRQDEPVNTLEDGDTCPDATGVGTDGASVIAERVGGEFGFEGNGRVYWIYFTATDTYGATCSDVVKVTVAHHMNATVFDNGPLYDSTSCP
jgi:hypothetical protein